MIYHVSLNLQDTHLLLQALQKVYDTGKIVNFHGENPKMVAWSLKTIYFNELPVDQTLQINDRILQFFIDALKTLEFKISHFKQHTDKLIWKFELIRETRKHLDKEYGTGEQEEIGKI